MISAEDVGSVAAGTTSLGICQTELAARKSGTVGAARVPSMKLVVIPSIAELRGTLDPKGQPSGL